MPCPSRVANAIRRCPCPGGGYKSSCPSPKVIKCPFGASGFVPLALSPLVHGVQIFLPRRGTCSATPRRGSPRRSFAYQRGLNLLAKRSFVSPCTCTKNESASRMQCFAGGKIKYFWHRRCNSPRTNLRFVRNANRRFVTGAFTSKAITLAAPKGIKS